jgi:flavin-dependent dehydrogenase
VVHCDALIVGGGPAGSTCARALRLAGWDVVVADRARFPRDKVCAGWLTPEVFQLLQLQPAEYRAAGRTLQEISAFRTGLIAAAPPIETRYTVPVSYAIRRCEFDTFLLRRAGVRVLEETPVATIRRQAETWVVNDQIRARVLVGAGGHFCPVARYLLRGHDSSPPIVAKELEFRLDGYASSVPADAPELFFCRDLQGYAWCVRKGDYLNVGIGRRDRTNFASHVQDFAAFLASTGRAPDTSHWTWHGHAYHAGGAGIRPLVAPGALLLGDAAGLAYPESGEGIKPAIESALIAAQSLVSAGGHCGVEALRSYETAIRARYPRPHPTPPLLQPLALAAGRALLQHSRWFTRRYVVERWFLHAS